MKPPSRLILRRPQPSRFNEEADAVTTLFLAARRATLPGLSEPHPDEETFEWMRNVVFPRQSVQLALLRDEIVGFAARDGAWLTQLWVKPGWTGHGIGQRLLEFVLEEAAKVTATLRVQTFQRNAGARRFYERNGFVAVTFGDGSGNEEKEPDVVYERAMRS
ncbi:MAG TPA: GNAT family N-acetyltransferase [Casimicrobiaceae bacterium]